MAFDDSLQTFCNLLGIKEIHAVGLVSFNKGQPMNRVKASAKGVLLLFTAVAVLLCTVVPASAQWKLVWSDEFAGPAGAAPNASKWTYESGNNNGWGNNEKEYYCAPGLAGQASCDLRNPNLRLDGKGDLVIEARRELADGKWTSGRMNTRGLFTQQYGRFEARIKLPKGQGLWPAFWLLGANSKSEGWPRCGEIDIMENLGHEPSKIHGSMHGPGYSGAHPLTASYLKTSRLVHSGSMIIRFLSFSTLPLAAIGRRIPTIQRFLHPSCSWIMFESMCGSEEVHSTFRHR